MNKSEVYSWRLLPDLKRRLTRAAEARNLSVSRLLTSITEEWLARTEIPGDEEEKRLREAALATFGAFDSGNPDASTDVSARVRAKLRAKRDAAAGTD